MSRILIIYTGGTIGMVHDSKTGMLKPFDFGKIEKRIPELKKLKCKIDFFAFEPLIDSSDMQPDKWIDIAAHISKNYKKYDSFIILHGTDTMSYTASALSFMLNNLSKPVILTGSQLSLEYIRTDARNNIITAVEIACLHGDKKIALNEVCIFFDDELYRGNRTEKYTSSKFDAFKSANYPVLCESGVEIKFDSDALLPKPSKAFKADLKMSNQVALLKLFPGMTQDYVNAIINIPGIKGIVMESYGSGNAPSGPDFINSLKKAKAKGIVIVNVSQCSGGSVEPGKYHSSSHLLDSGVISGADMTTEAAITKMMYLFGKGFTKTEVGKLMQKNLSGELSE